MERKRRNRTPNNDHEPDRRKIQQYHNHPTDTKRHPHDTGRRHIHRRNNLNHIHGETEDRTIRHQPRTGRRTRTQGIRLHNQRETRLHRDRERLAPHPHEALHDADESHDQRRQWAQPPAQRLELPEIEGRQGPRKRKHEEVHQREDHAHHDQGHPAAEPHEAHHREAGQVGGEGGGVDHDARPRLDAEPEGLLYPPEPVEEPHPRRNNHRKQHTHHPETRNQQQRHGRPNQERQQVHVKRLARLTYTVEQAVHRKAPQPTEQEGDQMELQVERREHEIGAVNDPHDRIRQQDQPHRNRQGDQSRVLHRTLENDPEPLILPVYLGEERIEGDGDGPREDRDEHPEVHRRVIVTDQADVDVDRHERVVQLLQPPAEEVRHV